MTQIFLHDIWHRHAQRRGEIPQCHGPLFLRILQQPNQAVRQGARVALLVEFHRQFFTVGHLPEIGEVGTYDGNAVGAGQMRHATAASRGRIGHHGDRGTLEHFCQVLLWNISGELDAGISGALFLHGFDITSGLRMIASAHHQPCMRQSLFYKLKSLQHEFQSFVGAPFSKGQNAMLGIAAPREVGKFGPLNQDAVRAKVHVVTAVSLVQNLAISRHQHRYGIRQQKHLRGQ